MFDVGTILNGKSTIMAMDVCVCVCVFECVCTCGGRRQQQKYESIVKLEKKKMQKIKPFYSMKK